MMRLGDRRAERRHPRGEPRRHAAAVQRKIVRRRNASHAPFYGLAHPPVLRHGPSPTKTKPRQWDSLLGMGLKSIRAWLGIDAPEEPQFAPLRETLEALDHLEPDRARFLAAFAYLLGRVARADQQVSPEETRTMEALVREQGQLSQDQAMVVVQLAKTSNLLFGGTANFLVAREF